MTDSQARRIEQAGYLTLVACLGIVQFTIFGANLIVIPGLLWLALAVHEGRRPDVPAFFWPLLALAGWTLVSCAFSLDPRESFTRSRQLLLFLIVPMTARFVRGERALTAVNVIIALGAAGALVGIVEYAALGFDDINHRPRGTLGHYMTYSGLLMLVTCTAAARLIYNRREWIWPAIAVPALLVALVLTETRNAWVGTLLAIGALLACRRLKLLLLVPLGAAVMAGLLVLAPAVVQQRASSIFDLHNPTNRDRLGMLESGLEMIRDHPLFGVGLNNVPRVYPQYPDGAGGRSGRHGRRRHARPPAQRSGAARGRARPARAGHLSLVRRRRWTRSVPAGTPRAGPDGGGRRRRGAGRHAWSRTVRA